MIVDSGAEDIVYTNLLPACTAIISTHPSSVRAEKPVRSHGLPHPSLVIPSDPACQALEALQEMQVRPHTVP
jgi:hypothetical protein